MSLRTYLPSVLRAQNKAKLDFWLEKPLIVWNSSSKRKVSVFFDHYYWDPPWRVGWRKTWMVIEPVGAKEKRDRRTCSLLWPERRFWRDNWGSFRLAWGFLSLRTIYRFRDIFSKQKVEPFRRSVCVIRRYANWSLSWGLLRWCSFFLCSSTELVVLDPPGSLLIRHFAFPTKTLLFRSVSSTSILHGGATTKCIATFAANQPNCVPLSPKNPHSQITIPSPNLEIFFL